MVKSKCGLSIKILLCVALLVFAFSGQVWTYQEADNDMAFYLFDEIIEIVEEENTEQIIIQNAEPGIIRDYAATAERIGIADICGIAASPGVLSLQDVLIVNVFEGKSYTVLVESITPESDSYSLRGSIEGSNFGIFTMSTVEDQTMAVLRLPEENKLYTLVYSPKIESYYLFEALLDQFDQQRVYTPPLEVDVSVDQLSEYKTAVQEQPAQLNFSQDLQVSGDPNQSATVDVMVVYTPAARNWAGGEAGMRNHINSAFEFANDALDNSNTGITLNLVHDDLVSYVESGDILQDLHRLRDTNDGHMDIIHTWRDQHNADLVALFSDSGNPNSWGGVGAIFNKDNPDQFNAENAAFSVSNVQGVARGYLAIHEWGHNFGAHHHRQQKTQPGPNESFGDYAAGWRFQVGSDWYSTIMSYEEGEEFGPGTPGAGITSNEVGYFSNPNVTYLGVPTGNATYGDNARVLRESKHIIAAYRDGEEPLPPAIRPSIPTLSSPAAGANVVGTSVNFSWNAAARAEFYQLRIVRISDNSNFYNQEVGNVTSINVPGFANDGESYRWSVRAGNSSGWSDFSEPRVFTNGTGDDPPPITGTSSIFLEHADGRVAKWLMEGITLIEANTLGRPEVDGWRLKAAVDINNNSHADLIYHHVDGWLSVLYMENNQAIGEAEIINPGDGTSRINPVWDLKAVYDLNNNGSPDLIWQRDNGELAIWFMSGLTAVSTGRLTHGDGLATVNPAWELRAVHDLLGNGLPEVLWQCVSGPHKGEVAFWELDGFARGGGGRLTNVGGRASIDPVWTMRAVHDLLGNGRPEIIWQHDNGRIAYWEMNGSNFVGSGRIHDLDDPRWVIIDCTN